VDSTGFAPGTYTASVRIATPGGVATVTIQVSVPLPKATTGWFIGRVLDGSNDHPLPGATVTLRTAGRESGLTDARGFFRIPVEGEPDFYIADISKEGYTEAQREGAIAPGHETRATDTRVMPLDPASMTVDAAGGTLTSDAGDMQVEVPPGAIGAPVEIRATRYPTSDDLPLVLPDEVVPTMALSLTLPADFSKPITYRIANDLGFAPGEPVPVGWYDAEDMMWKADSMGVVSDDGQWCVFQVSPDDNSVQTSRRRRDARGERIGAITLPFDCNQPTNDPRQQRFWRRGRRGTARRSSPGPPMQQ